MRISILSLSELAHQSHPLNVSFCYHDCAHFQNQWKHLVCKTYFSGALLSSGAQNSSETQVRCQCTKELPKDFQISSYHETKMSDASRKLFFCAFALELSLNYLQQPQKEHCWMSQNGISLNHRFPVDWQFLYTMVIYYDSPIKRQLGVRLHNLKFTLTFWNRNTVWNWLNLLRAWSFQVWLWSGSYIFSGSTSYNCPWVRSQLCTLEKQLWTLTPHTWPTCLNGFKILP